MYPVNENDPNNDNWDSVPDNQMAIGTSNGNYTLCQESSGSFEERRYYRGNSTLTGAGTAEPTTNSFTLGFRPCLVLES